jgi:divalent metal cation (Fe/Co/Zn/Cd) transporter
MVAIDTVRAFHLSFGFLVEIDIVLPEEMTLREAHDIGEALQWKIEALPEVERAFVHLDYEVDHKPSTSRRTGPTGRTTASASGRRRPTRARARARADA